MYPNAHENEADQPGTKGGWQTPGKKYQLQFWFISAKVKGQR